MRHPTDNPGYDVQRQAPEEDEQPGVEGNPPQLVLPQVLEMQPNGTGAYRLIRIQQVILVGILDRHGEEAVEEG